MMSRPFAIATLWIFCLLGVAEGIDCETGDLVAFYFALMGSLYVLTFISLCLMLAVFWCCLYRRGRIIFTTREHYLENAPLGAL